MNMKPLFIFSLPRAGSTLLQRLLMTHANISSASEPWLLLPLVYMQKKDGVLSTYSHSVCYDAIEDLIESMQGGRQAYDYLMSRFVLGVYEQIAQKGAQYFLDKTPRYYLIIPEIARLFPDAKFIFLFRNPADVFASVVTTWGGGGFERLWVNWMDLESGPGRLAEGYELLKDRACVVHYENLVSDPELCLRGVFNYLELEFDPTILSNFIPKAPQGRMGDPTGVTRYRGLSGESVENWKNVFNRTFRKRVLLDYIRGLPEHVLATHGYSKSALLDAISAHRTSGGVGQAADYMFYMKSKIIRATHGNLFLGAPARWARNMYVS